LSLFQSKKKESFSSRLEPLPEFPDLSSDSELPAFPDDEMDNIKKEVNKESPDEEDLSELPSFEMPARSSPHIKSLPSDMLHSSDHPLFIKLDQYKTILDDVHSLRKKTQEAERLLMELERLQESQAKLLSSWKEEISEVKRKLLDVDEQISSS